MVACYAQLQGFQGQCKAISRLKLRAWEIYEFLKTNIYNLLFVDR